MYSILDGNDLNVIKEALVDIMRTTCIKFVPHSNEPDYIVFVEYKDPNQKTGFIIFYIDKYILNRIKIIMARLRRTCWSGKGSNNGTSSIGNKKGRHIVSLWRDLECFNKLYIIREVSNVLGFQTKSSTLIFKPKSRIIHGI